MAVSRVLTYFSWFAYNTNHESRVTHQDMTVRLYISFAPTTFASSHPLPLFYLSYLLTLRSYIILHVRTLDMGLKSFKNALANLVS